MAYCIVEDCPRALDADDPKNQGLCFYHRIRTLQFTKGDLVNRLHPGLTTRESKKKIVDDAARNGYEATPVQEHTWT